MSNPEPTSRDDTTGMDENVEEAERLKTAGSNTARLEPANFSQTLPAKFPPMKEVTGDLSRATAGNGNPPNRSNSPDRADRMMSVPALEYNRLVESERMNRAKVEELTNRLSSFASRQLKENNPNIADLSDRNRPTKLGERFEQIYDNEWSEAYEYVRGVGGKFGQEDMVIQVLADITQKIYEFCHDFAGQQLPRLESYFMHGMTEIKWSYQSSAGDNSLRVHRNPEDKAAFYELPRLMQDSRRSCAMASVPALCEMFKSHVYKEHFAALPMERRLEMYIDKCVECIFLMSVQDPPMHLEFPVKGEKMESSQFKPFRKKGEIVQFCVWPAIHLHKNGPLVSKGFVLPQ